MKKSGETQFRHLILKKKLMRLIVFYGRCKVVFANKWYEYDDLIKDFECEQAKRKA